MSSAIPVGTGGAVLGSRAATATQRADAELAHVRFGRWILVGTDAGALIGVAWLGVAVWGWILGRAAPTGTTGVRCWWPFVPLALALMAVYGLYRRPGRRVRSLTFLDLAHLFHSLTLAGLASLAVSGLVHRFFGGPKLTWSEVAACAAPALVVLPAVRAGVTAVMDRRSIPRTRVIMVGSGRTALRVAERLARFGDIDLVGWVSDAPGGESPATPATAATAATAATPAPSAPHPPTLPAITKLGRFLGPARDVAALCREYSADRVLVALDDPNGQPVVEWSRDLPPSTRVSVVPPFSEVLTCRSSVDELHGLAVIDLAPAVAGTVQRAAKRVLDVVVSAWLLIVLAPFFAVIRVMIRRGSPGPILFRQIRAGRHGEPFVVLKFRTMRDDAEEAAEELRPFNDVDGPIFKLRTDPRVTPAGRFLRRFSLDELPQLLNVLRGDMSLVGPRPFPLDEAQAISGWAARRFDVRPGMTGYWQVSGRNDLTFAELQQLDYAYVASWSLWWDLKILWQTPGAVLARRGAY